LCNWFRIPYKGHWYKLKYPFATQHKKKIPNEVVLIVNDTDRLWLTNWYDSVNFITKQELRDSNLEIILE
jgi:transcriptional regulatory protein LevR